MGRKLIFAACLWSATISGGCTRLESVSTNLGLPGSMFEPGDGALNPSSDKLASDCDVNPDYDACLILKNPVAQEDAAVNASAVDGLRRFGVKIRGLSSTGYLDNGRVQVQALNTPRFKLGDKSRFKPRFSESGSDLEQLNAYYWSNRALEYLAARLGAARVKMTPLKIYADDSFTGYSSTRNSIHLEKTSGRVPNALSAEIVIQLLGQALAQDLSNRALFPGAAAQHKSCGTSPRGCCATEAGCSQALGSGFGDYVAAMIFPGSPRLGESAAGSPAGQSLCGMTRDLMMLAAKSKSEVYSACAGTPGFVSLMGAWYASQWWKARALAEAQGSGGAADIDAIFFEHARAWNSSSTFAGAKAAALAASAQFKNGKYTTLLTTALSALE